MNKPVTVVVGVGPGNGAAFTRRFASQGYSVALLARNEQFLNELEGEISGARAYIYDVTSIDTAEAVFHRIREELGAVEILIYNAGAGKFSNIEQTTVDAFQRAWEVNARGLLVAAQQVIPHMRELKKGSIVVIGATASIKGGANFAPFASAKAAQRSLAQSMARHLGPKKIHVSYVILDGVVDLERTRQSMPDKPDEFFLKPDDIAQSVFFLTQQAQQAWTFELDLRPFMEKW